MADLYDRALKDVIGELIGAHVEKLTHLDRPTSVPGGGVVADVVAHIDGQKKCLTVVEIRGEVTVFDQVSTSS